MNAELLRLLEIADRDGWWVPLATYLREYSDTPQAVYTRRSKGIWKDGIHSKFVRGGGIWINLVAVNTWVAKSELRLVSQSAKTQPDDESGSGSHSCSRASSAAKG